MSRRARTRRDRRVAVNSIEIAISRARRLDDADVVRQLDIVRTALREFCCGLHCRTHWASLADTANIAETLSTMGLGRGDDADRLIEDAQQALHDAWQRHQQRGTWTLYADEIAALQYLVSLHAIQLEACSYGEFEDAYRRTAQRMAQALAGNVGAGTVVVGEVRHASGG